MTKEQIIELSKERIKEFDHENYRIRREFWEEFHFLLTERPGNTLRSYLVRAYVNNLEAYRQELDEAQAEAEELFKDCLN